MTNLQRRLTQLEAVLLDPVGLVPHSQRWIEYWDRQFYLYMTGQDLTALRHCPLPAWSAVMKYAKENPASLVGSIPNPYE